MTVAKTLATSLNVPADITAATTNLTAAQSALDAHITGAGNAAYHKILVDIDTADKAQKATFEAEFKAINECVPDVVTAWYATNSTSMKTEKNYDAMTADEKAAFDKKVAERITKKNAEDAELKTTAKYHEMTADERTMFDKMLVAQKTLDSAEIKEFGKGQND